MKKSNKIQAMILIDVIEVLTMALGTLAEFGACYLMNYRVPSWSFPAAVRGMDIIEATKYMLSQPWYSITLIVVIGFCLIAGPMVIYPYLCRFFGVEE